jgi:hypothetical protein
VPVGRAGPMLLADAGTPKFMIRGIAMTGIKMTGLKG